jgi:hypothetical protein
LLLDFLSSARRAWVLRKRVVDRLHVPSGSASRMPSKWQTPGQRKVLFSRILLGRVVRVPGASLPCGYVQTPARSGYSHASDPDRARPAGVRRAWLRRHFAASPVSVEAVYGDEDARPILRS